MATRCRGREDVIFIQDTLGTTTLDPISRDGIVTKMGSDCTKPLGRDKESSPMIHHPCYYPTNTVDLSQYIGGWKRF